MSYSIVTYSIMRYSTVTYSIMRYSTVTDSIMRYSIVTYSIVTYITVKYSTVRSKNSRMSRELRLKKTINQTLMEMECFFLSAVRLGTIYMFRLLNLHLHMRTSNETLYIFCLMLVL